MEYAGPIKKLLDQLKIHVLLSSGTSINYTKSESNQVLLIQRAVELKDSRVDQVLLKLLNTIDDEAYKMHIYQHIKPVCQRHISNA